jgi:hypothetical protein
LTVPVDHLDQEAVSPGDPADPIAVEAGLARELDGGGEPFWAVRGVAGERRVI